MKQVFPMTSNGPGDEHVSATLATSKKYDTFTLLFLGSGCSSSIPQLGHLLQEQTCSLCLEAHSNSSSKNRRNNVSIALLYEISGERKCVIVDVGKTFRDSFLRYLICHRIETVNGILITHGHADAMMGMDDLRDLQHFEKVDLPGGETGCRVTSGALPVYMHQATMDVVSSAFGYLNQSADYFEGTDILRRHTTLIDFVVIEPNANISISGLSVQCFPVYHGGSYISLGYNFGRPGELVYISDVKVIPEETWTYLDSISPINLFVIDMLSTKGIYSHLGLQEALDIVDRLKPTRTLFTGMSCYAGDHDKLCAKLAKTHPSVSLAFDGMMVESLHMS